MKTKNLTILHLRKSIGRSPLRLGFLLIALAWFALSPPAQAVTPPPDGGYPGFNTAEGSNALFSLTTGTENTATGAAALRLSNGSGNTAIGAFALFNNATAELNTAHGWKALYRNTTGEGNIVLGAAAGQNLTTGSDNIYIVADAKSEETANSVPAAAVPAAAVSESNTIRIGDSSDEGQTDAFIAGISGVTVAGGVG